MGVRGWVVLVGVWMGSWVLGTSRWRFGMRICVIFWAYGFNSCVYLIAVLGRDCVLVGEGRDGEADTGIRSDRDTGRKHAE
jgi:hypothetical protein